MEIIRAALKRDKERIHLFTSTSKRYEPYEVLWNSRNYFLIHGPLGAGIRRPGSHHHQPPEGRRREHKATYTYTKEVVAFGSALVLLEMAWVFGSSNLVVECLVVVRIRFDIAPFCSSVV